MGVENKNFKIYSLT